MKTVLLIGLGKFGRHVAEQLQIHGHQVMAIDKNEDRVNSVLSYTTNAQIGDTTNIDFLRSLGVDEYDLCVVTIGNDFQASLETTAYLKELGATFVVSRAYSGRHAKFLLRNGADKVVYPEKEVAKWAAVRYTTNNITDYIQVDAQHSIYKVTIPKNWEGKTLAELNVRSTYGLNILGIKEEDGVRYTFSPNEKLEKGAELLILGENNAFKRCFDI